MTGLLFTHWIADSLTLWKSPATQSDARLWTAASYYSILTRVPAELLYVYSGVAALGGATLLWSLGDGRAGNFMFDGGSICEYLVGIIVRSTNNITASAVHLGSRDVSVFCHTKYDRNHPCHAHVLISRTGLTANFSRLPLPFAHPSASTTTPGATDTLPPFPATLRGPTLELASSHLICSVALTGVLVLQAGRWWAEQKDVDDDDEDEDGQPAAESGKSAADSAKAS